MTSILEIVFPILLMFLSGVILKKTKLLKKDDGDVLLRLIFYIGFPALVFHALSTIELAYELLFFPIAGVLLIGINYFLAIIAAKFLKLSKPSRGVFIISSMIINTGFLLPFVIAGFGPEGIVRIAIFDLAGTTLVFTWIYAIACRHNPAGQSHKIIVKKLLISPPLWATILGIICNVGNISVPQGILSLTENVGAIVAPLFMIALGLFFDPKIVNLAPTITAIGIRMVFGTILGFLLASVFGLTGINKQILILLAASPIGINTITFASLENLNKELAASIVSVGLLVGLILTPLLMVLLHVT